MFVVDGNFPLGCESGMDYPKIHIFVGMLERRYAITKEVLETNTFVLAYPTVLARVMVLANSMRILHKTSILTES